MKTRERFKLSERKLNTKGLGRNTLESGSQKVQIPMVKHSESYTTINSFLSDLSDNDSQSSDESCDTTEDNYFHAYELDTAFDEHQNKKSKNEKDSETSIEYQEMTKTNYCANSLITSKLCEKTAHHTSIKDLFIQKLRTQLTDNTNSTSSISSASLYGCRTYYPEPDNLIAGKKIRLFSPINSTRNHRSASRIRSLNSDESNFAYGANFKNIVSSIRLTISPSPRCPPIYKRRKPDSNKYTVSGFLAGNTFSRTLNNTNQRTMPYRRKKKNIFKEELKFMIWKMVPTRLRKRKEKALSKKTKLEYSIGYLT